MVHFKISSLSVSLAQPEVSAFSAFYWSIHAVFTGFKRCRTQWCSYRWLLSYCFAQQTGSVSIFLLVINWKRFHRKEVSQNPKDNGEVWNVKTVVSIKKMQTLPLWLVLMFDGSAFCSITAPEKMTTETTDTNIVIVYNNLWHSKEDNSHKKSWK